MPSLSYDLIVLGNDFAGLVAASLCASRGMRVLIAETGKRRDSYRLGAEVLPVAPLSISGMDEPVFAKVMQELHFQHLLKRRLEVLDPPCQFLIPNLRLEADADRLRFSRGLKREMGSDDGWLLDADEAQAGFRELLETDSCVPPTGFWERRELGKLASAAHASCESWRDAKHDPRSEALSDLAMSALMGTNEGSALSRARAFSIARQGMASVEGDWETWRSIFVDKFKSHNGEIRKVRAQQLHVGWGKVTGLSAIDDDFSCDNLIASQPIDQLLPLLGKKPPKRLTELAQQVEPLAFRYTLNLIVQMSAVPEGIGKLAWSQLDPEGSETGGNFASFNIRPATQAGRALVCMQGLATVGEDGEPDLRGMREGLLAHAREIMPFVEAHLESVDSPHEEAEKTHKRDLPELVAPEPIWGCPVDDTLLLPALPYSVGLKHLFLASAQTLPDLGLEGQLIAGWSAARLATAGMGKRSSSSKRTVLAENRF